MSLSKVSARATFSFATEPSITKLMDDLRACPRENFTQATSKITWLAEVLKTTTALTPTNHVRASYISSALKEELEGQIKINNKKIVVLVPVLTFMKTELEKEAITIGLILPFLQSINQIYTIPELEFLKAELPAILSFLEMERSEGFYTIKMEALADYLMKFHDAACQDSTYDLLISHIHMGCLSIDESSVKISIEFEPDQELIAKGLSSNDKKANFLAFILQLFNRNLRKTLTLEQEEELSINLEKEFQKTGISNEMTPYLSLLMENIDGLIFDPDRLKMICDAIPPTWLQEAADTYEFLAKFDLYIRKVYKTKPLDIKESLRDPTLSNHLLTFVDVINPLDAIAGYPLKTTRLWCDTKSEFLKLPLSKPFFTAPKIEPSATTLCDAELLASLEEVPAGAGASYVKPRGKGTKVAVLASIPTASAEAPISSIEEEELHDITVLMPKKPLHPRKTPKKPPTKIEKLHTAINLSVAETQQFLNKTFLYKRVSDWWISPEAGLAHRELDPSRADFEAKKLELEITHDFPYELLLFACNRSYAIPGVFGDLGSMKFNHFSSIVFINEEKYNLTVAFSAKGGCYHFHAKKISSWKDHFSAELIESSTKALASDRVDVSKKPHAKTIYIIDDLGNVTFNYKGRVITIFKLS